MTELSPFKLAILIGFGVAIVGGFLAISMFSGVGGGGTTRVALWGTVPTTVMNGVIQRAVPDDAPVLIEYRQIAPESFDNELLQALAAGRGPDLVLMPNDKIVMHRDKIWTIPFETYDERRFQSTFARAGEIFLRPDGVVGLPLTIDPLVLYWNRTLFDQNRVVNPPRTWASFNDDPMKSFILRDGSRIDRSMVALGNFDNVRNAKSILAALMMQSGSSLVRRTSDGYQAALIQSSRSGLLPPAVTAVNFYTQFANSSRPVYTWNSALPESRQAFLNGDLAVYFGFASERRDLIAQNPNLDFGVELLPQASESTEQLTVARVQGLAILNRSPNKGAALAAAMLLSDREGSLRTAELLELPPVRRDLLGERQNRAHMIVFYDSVHIARAWLDPNPARSTEIFRDMVQAIQSGRLRTADAVSRANNELQNIF
ncbi:MAG: extracellular solute-binding protein [Candidatus Paceibacterota bacterium]